MSRFAKETPKIRPPSRISSYVYVDDDRPTLTPLAWFCL